MLRILLLILCCATHLIAQQQPHAFTNALIYPITGDPIENGVLIVQEGKIIAVGAAADVTLPGNAVIHDMAGKQIMPGMVDTHSHLGVTDLGGDASAAIHPEVRIIDSIEPTADSFMRALSGGITTLNVMPGSGHLMSGQTVYIKMREGKTIDDLTFCGDVQNEVCGGMKMANGTNSLQGPPNFPGTRAKSAAMVREEFIKAQEYQRKVAAAKGDAAKLPARDLRMEGLVDILEGKRIVHFHTHKQNDIMTAIRLSKEFDFKLVLQHVSEAWMVADEIAAAGVPASIIMPDSPGGKMEMINNYHQNGSILDRAGVDVAFHTDDWITDSRLFIRLAGLAVREGMSKDKALEALTLAGARMMELQDRVGSLEVGKDADFIILSGDPLSVYTHIEETWVEGVKRFDRSIPEDRAFATGGYRVYLPNAMTHIH